MHPLCPGWRGDRTAVHITVAGSTSPFKFGNGSVVHQPPVHLWSANAQEIAKRGVRTACVPRSDPRACTRADASSSAFEILGRSPCPPHMRSEHRAHAALQALYPRTLVGLVSYGVRVAVVEPRAIRVASFQIANVSAHALLELSSCLASAGDPSSLSGGAEGGTSPDFD
ncbi:hypothetical protein WOLCODRAFT_147740 [Wolfiporia cocos MD-104 SS10]|uniref:Uncharacterized protein n=1 Tax=Wolfiporia cocos (strain MD-104) TaxID=742152 RepID=A0A2H3IUJ6_WOLCO|nr:hypothetical protein WOLCODRAFT_147740 [Wolfiporia cocos MD-104 SS10]